MNQRIPLWLAMLAGAAFGAVAVTGPNAQSKAPGASSFTFLGFSHIWGKSRAGKNVVRQVTAKNRYARALAAVTAWCQALP
jgi:hypothetical protein